jgi:hypothetical protein
METQNNYWQERHEALLKMYIQQKQQLDQWQAGGILWTWEDVHTYASDELGIRLSMEDCKTILDNAIGSHDADQGITWDTFRNEIENFIQ